MKIRWLENHIWEVILDINPHGEPLIGNMDMRRGDTLEPASVQINKEHFTATIKLNDGRVMFGVPLSIFEWLQQ